MAVNHAQDLNGDLITVVTDKVAVEFYRNVRFVEARDVGVERVDGERSLYG